METGSISRTLWLALVFLSLFVAAGYSDDTPVKSVSVTNKIFDVLARPVQNHIAGALGAGEMSQLPPASDPDLTKALNEHLRKILLKKGDSHFTQEATGRRRPIEIKGFELHGPIASLVSEADRLNGIQQIVLFSAKGSAYREYDSKSGWGKWKSGKPPLLSGLRMQLVDKAWQVASSPLDHYRID